MIDQLEHFLHIVEEGTFTAASKKAHLSQPALTASIQRLEEAVGARLLDRGPGGASLNSAGRAFRPWAEATVAAFDSGCRAVSAVEGLETGEVRMGGGATVCTYLLPPVLIAYRERHPGILIRLRETDSAHTRYLVSTGQLDIGVVPGEGDTPWRADALILVSAPGHPTADQPHIGFPRGTHVRDVLEANFPEAEVVMELNSTTAIKGHVRAGMGIALLSEAAVAHDVREGRLIQVPHTRTPIRRHLSLVHDRPARMSPAALAMRSALLKA